MDKLYKAKFFYFIFLLPIFLMNKNLFSHSSFFWLARLESVSAGAMGPLRHQMDSCYKKKDFDEPISENNEYGEQARNIADFFIKKYKNELPSTISSEKLLDDIICYSKIEGSSIDLILYAELLARHKKIDLNGIYIAGSGQIDVATGVCNSVTSLFHKLNAGIYYGIRIFIFSSQQKKDIENCCNSYIHNGGDQVIQQISFYYVDNVDQLEGVLCDISKTKKKAYDRKAIWEIRKMQHESNFMSTGVTNMDSSITKEFIKNKKVYGNVCDMYYLELYPRENLLNARENKYKIIKMIEKTAFLVKINNATSITKEQSALLEKLLEEIIFPLDPFYKKYYQSCVSEIIVTDQDILDM